MNSKLLLVVCDSLTLVLTLRGLSLAFMDPPASDGLLVFQKLRRSLTGSSDRSAMQPKPRRRDQILSELEQQYEKNIRPLLDVVDRLRSLGVMEEGINLPSIVVVGDQSSGKSSVLESLACIKLPRGQGIATRVPLVLRLQRCPVHEPTVITIGYGETKEYINEEDINSAVERGTCVLAGNGKDVTDTPISLHIRKPNAPDLTMIDLPGITRVPVHGQPENIYEQISAMIQHYIKPKETVILNVLSATVDFPTCESIRMSQKEDKAGERTLAVVTKVDRSPDGLYEKVTGDAVNIGLGYVCVRNRATDDESHEEARVKEASLFKFHPTLSKLDKDMVGIPALAERLTTIQAGMIRRCLPDIVKKIDKALLDRENELDSLPPNVADEVEAEVVIVKIMAQIRTVLEEVLVHGNFRQFPEDREKHYTARVDEVFHKFSQSLDESASSLGTKMKSQEIVELIAEGRGVHLPNFLNGTIFQGLVRSQINDIKLPCQRLVTDIHEYAQRLVIAVIQQFADSFASMKSTYERCAEKVLAKARDDCLIFVNRELEKESIMVHNINNYYVNNVREIQKLKEGSPSEGQNEFPLEELRQEIEDIRQNPNDLLQSALDMKIYLIAYWNVVHKRLADGLTFQIRYTFRMALLSELGKALLTEKIHKGVSYLTNEDPGTSRRRIRLKQSVQVLRESYQILVNLLKG